MAVRGCVIRTNSAYNVLGQLKKQTGAKRGVRNALTSEQQAAFLDFMDGHPVYGHWKPIYTFFIGTEVRVGELSGLIWKDIDVENGVIIVGHAAVYFAGKMNKFQKRTYISNSKTDAGIRKIPMVKKMRQALNEIKQYQHNNWIFYKIEIDGYTDFVFLNRFGWVLLQQDLDRALGCIIDAYNDTELHEAKMKNREPLILSQGFNGGIGRKDGFVFSIINMEESFKAFIFIADRKSTTNLVEVHQKYIKFRLNDTE